MATSESCKRLMYSDSESEGIDRISSLPEALQSKILSLLPIKDAIATSLLSKSWRFVWTCITSLSFNGKYSGKDFTQFMNNVLIQLNTSCIQNFTLSCLPRSDSLNMQSLVCAAIQRTIQKLELNLLLAEPMELPWSHFNCKTLSVLKLSSRDIHFNVVESASICFPNLQSLYLSRIRFTIATNCSISFPILKDLHLIYVKYANEESVHKLFASCPVLDSLHLFRGDCPLDNLLNTPLENRDNIRVFIISIPSLRSLQMSHIYTCQEYKVQIDTPALEYLYLYSELSFCKSFLLENLSSLLNAKVKFGLYQRSDIQLDSTRKSEENISKSIGGLFDMRFLSISRRTLETIGSIPQSIAPVFRNLTRLELGMYTCRDSFIVIEKLLERSDNLEHLIMTGYNSCGSHESRWIEPSSVPMCLLRRVTTISLTDIGDCSTEFELVRYFLKNAEVLEQLTIGIFRYSEEKFQLIKQKISMIPRASRACQVEFR